MKRIIDKIKKGNVEMKLPDTWSRRKSWYVGFGLICLSSLFGSMAYHYNNLFYLYVCILTAFFSGQIYYIVYNWDELKKIKQEKDLGKCIYAVDFGDGIYCSKGFTTIYKKCEKYEPDCKSCKYKTLEVK